jgi:hypothetical protein
LIVFGGGFPVAIRAQVVEALLQFASEDPEGFVAAFEPLVWDGLEEVTADDLAPVQELLRVIGFGLDDL